MATLTDAGYAKVVASAPSHVETVRQLVFDGLDRAQVRQLQEISEQLLRSLDAECPSERLGAQA
jgi:hypothetical protein